MTLASFGCELTLVGRHRRKLSIAEAVGASVHSPEALHAGDFDVVIEATGSPEGFGFAMERVRPRGVLVLKSTFHGSSELNTAKLVIDEIQVVGSRCGPFEPAIRALAHRQVDPSPLLDRVFPLSEGLEALRHALEPGVLKVLVDMR
jgi:threonine dehydrogenase-like Zn-dependent dehydrogenase